MLQRKWIRAFFNLPMMMTTNIRAIFCLVLLFSICSSANASDLLWSKVVARSIEMNKWVAQDLESDIESVEGDVFRVKSTLHAAGWNKDRPVYAISKISLEPEMPNEKAPSPSDFDAFIRLADTALSEGMAVTRSDNQLLDGQLWTKFQWEIKKIAGSRAFTAWVSPETGCLHKFDSHIHIPIMADMNIVKHYELDRRACPNFCVNGVSFNS